jgi:hypothetical protein
MPSETRKWPTNHPPCNSLIGGLLHGQVVWCDFFISRFHQPPRNPQSFWPRRTSHGAGIFLRERRCKARQTSGASTVGKPALAQLRTAVPECKVKFESETVGLEATQRSELAVHLHGHADRPRLRVVQLSTLRRGCVLRFCFRKAAPAMLRDPKLSRGYRSQARIKQAVSFY